MITEPLAGGVDAVVSLATVPLASAAAVAGGLAVLAVSGYLSVWTVASFAECRHIRERGACPDGVVPTLCPDCRPRLRGGDER